MTDGVQTQNLGKRNGPVNTREQKGDGRSFLLLVTIAALVHSFLSRFLTHGKPLDVLLMLTASLTFKFTCDWHWPFRCA